MPGDDDAPLSSYSDPLYDRLDAMARQVKRMWWLFALGLIVVIAISVAIRVYAHREPLALGAAMAIEARNAEGDKATAAWKTLADGPDNDPGFRAAACIELAEIGLSAGDKVTANARAKQAEELARTAKDDDLRLAAMLSQASIAADSGDHEAALAQYEKCSQAAGALYPARRLAAELGAARSLEKLGRIDDAIQRLEPLTTRSDSGAGQLINLATATYWRLKRQQAEAKLPADAKPTDAAATDKAATKTAGAPAEAKPAVAPAPAEKPVAEAKPAVAPAPAEKPAAEAKPTVAPAPVAEKPAEKPAAAGPAASAAKPGN